MTDAANPGVPGEPANIFAAVWLIDVMRIGETGAGGLHHATPEQCAALAGALDLIECTALRVAFKVRSLHRGRYKLTGTVSADVVQRCVVTLDPVPAKVEEQLDIEFWPAGQMGADQLGADARMPPLKSSSRREQAEESDERNDTADFAVIGDEPPEPIEQGRIAVGRVVFELLSAGLDPYPRAAGAELGWSTDEDTSGDHPFAALGKIAAIKPPAAKE
jgi:hypothetical protein